MSVTGDGGAVIAHAGSIGLRMLAENTGLTEALSHAMARRGFVPGRDRGRAVTDTVSALAAGASCLSDVEATTAQVELFGPAGGASDRMAVPILPPICASRPEALAAYRQRSARSTLCCQPPKVGHCGANGHGAKPT